VERIRAWARRPSADDTIAICDELRRSKDVRGNHVDALARAINQRHSKDAAVLLALGRLQLATGKLSDAQQTFVASGRLDPSARGPYRYLGEVLLRRGDAARAEKMLEKATDLEAQGQEGDPLEEPADEWLGRARLMRALQDSQGEGAVAAEIAMMLKTGRRNSPVRASFRPPTPIHFESDDEPTQVGRVPENLRRRAAGFETQVGGSEPPLPDPDRSIPQAAPIPAPAPPPALRRRTTPPPIPKSSPPAAPIIAHAASLPSLAEISDATTLPRGPEDSAELVNTSELIASSAAPTMRVDSEELESVPHLRAHPPRVSDDLSPPPQKPPMTTTGALRALKAESITLGGEPARDEKMATARHRASVPPIAALNGAPAPGAPWETKKVLDALEKAGVYEPAAAAASPAQWMSRREIPRTKRRGAWLYALLGVLLVGGIGGAIYGTDYLKKKNQNEAEQTTQHAEAEVRKTGLEALGTAEKDLQRAFELDSRTLRGARVWLQDRVLRSQLWPAEDRRMGGLASAIERGKTVGLQEPELAFARIALALSSDDTPSAAALAKTLDPGTAKDKNDAWRELAVGWVLERAGDARAVDRYAHAAELDPDLVAARLALAKLTALAGDSDRVTTLLKDVPNDLAPTRDDLVALAKLVKTGTPSKGGAPEPRRPEGFGWIVPALIVADPAASAEARKKEAARAFALAHEPGDLIRVGRLAVSAGDEATAGKAALRALEVSPIFPPARALAARLALGLGRPDDAGRALEGLVAEGDPEVAALRAWLAYERGDIAAVAQQLEDPLVSGAVDRNDLASIVKPLRFAIEQSKKPPGNLSSKVKAELESIQKMGELGPLVAFDVALDANDTDAAEAIGKGFGEVAQKPARAMRLAKLARIQGKAEEAERLSRIAIEQGTVTASALVERVLVLGSLGKGADALTLLGRFPLLAADEQPWLRAWASAQAGKRAEAKKAVDTLKDPEKKAPFAVRRDALLAISAAGDEKRAKPMAKDLLKERPGDRDVQAAAKNLNVK
jgi:Flp pilus assembly protein TadD